MSRYEWLITIGWLVIAAALFVWGYVRIKRQDERFEKEDSYELGDDAAPNYALYKKAHDADGDSAA